MLTTLFKRKKLSNQQEIDTLANSHTDSSCSTSGLLASLLFSNGQAKVTLPETDCTELTELSDTSVALQEIDIYELATKLRFGNFDKSSHIDFLEAEVKSQLAFTKSNLETREQFELFNQFQLEYNQHITNRSLNYEWWIYFALRLTILITPKDSRSTYSVEIEENRQFLQEVLTNKLWHRHEDFTAHLQRKDLINAERLRYSIGLFPNYIMIPTTLGDIDITLLNRTAAANIYPLGILSKGTWADNQFYFPDRFIRHDWVHFSNWLILDMDNYPSVQLFQSFMRHLIDKTIDPRLKFQYEFMLFYLIREAPLKLMRIQINDHRLEDSNYQIKSILLTEARDPMGLLKHCLSDKWYGPLLAEYASSEKETNHFVLEAIDNLIVCLNEFFAFINNDSFLNKPSVERNYTIDTPLNETEKAAHWTAANPQAAQIIQKNKIQFGEPGFIHYLVRCDSKGPDYGTDPTSNLLAITFRYLRRKRNEFKWMFPEERHMKLLADHMEQIIATKKAGQPSEESPTSIMMIRS